LNELSYDLYGKYKIERTWNINSVNKQLRLIRKNYSKIVDRNSPFFPLKDWLDGYVEFLESWKHYLVIRKDLKQYIVKGRKVDPNAPKKEVFQPSHLDSASRQLIEKTLRKITDTTAPRVAESVAKRYIEWAKKFLNEHDGETPIRKFYRSNPDYGSFLMRFVEDVSPNAGRFGGQHYYEMRSDAVQNAKKIAEKRTTMMMDNFIVKNVAKIGPVMKIKGGLTGIDIINMGVSGPSISANIKVSFNDGTSFEVRNKAVMKWSWPKPFYQFPTTFHNVVFPDGKKKKMVPEKAMNTDWAKRH